jgi:secreted trypsin-like serine protease
VIQAVTGDDGDEVAPPRAIAVSQQACAGDQGGGVYSPATNALLGIVSFALGPGCGDPAGRTIALRLAAFRRLLFDAAREANESLHVEASVAPPTGVTSPTDALLACAPTP